MGVDRMGMDIISLTGNSEVEQQLLGLALG